MNNRIIKSGFDLKILHFFYFHLIGLQIWKKWYLEPETV